MNVYGVRSRDKFFGRTTAHVQHDIADPTRVGVMAWFHDLLLTADKMPDSPDYMLPAPHKKTVYQWYMTDHGEHPTVYPKVSAPYFLRVWREEFRHVKLRRYLRFSKCCFCVLHRAVRWDKTTSKKKKREAMTRLREHYRWIRQERAYARVKQNLAILHPDEYLSIAIDGYNLPTFSSLLFSHVFVSRLYTPGVRTWATVCRIFRSSPRATRRSVLGTI